MTAIVAGPDRQGPLAGRVEQPLGRQPFLERLELERQVPEPRRLDGVDVELHRAGRLVQVDAAVHDDPQPGLGLEGAAHAVVAEPHALELVALVLEREVGVPGGRHRHPTDLALHPQVDQPRVLADRAADGAGDLADAEDPEPERAGRGGPASRRGPGRRTRLGPWRRRRGSGRSGAPRRPRTGHSQPGRAQSGGSRSARHRQPLAIRAASGTPRSACRRGWCRRARRRSGPGR